VDTITPGYCLRWGLANPPPQASIEPQSF
jgi:hypothetical protein